MKHSLILILLLLSTNSHAQVTLFDNANFSGKSKTLTVGQQSLTDFGDLASSIRVAPGYVAVLYEHADTGGGYGISVDLLEDRQDLSVYRFNNIASYVSVFAAKKDNLVYARARIENGQFIAGHWEREKARPSPPNTVAVVAPSLPAHGGNSNTEMQTSGAITTITNLGVLSPHAASLWDQAEKQLGIIGNDYRGEETLGSACFQRPSNSSLIPDNINFWYLQHQKRDHRPIRLFKRTLVGTVRETKQENIAGTYQDYDVTVDIVPDPNYRYLITDAEPRKYTRIMDLEYNGSRIVPLLEDQGQKNCNDRDSKAEFTFLEAEISPEHWPQGSHLFGRSALAGLCLDRGRQKICVYGPWIYDEGHCRHPEIHPAEQLWWSSDSGTGKKYNCNVICDASGRFWWRRQMDDGTKLKPWAAPPIKGLFAIAFEVPLPPTETAVGQVTKKFEVSNIEDYNVIQYSGADQTYQLVYKNKTLASFIPHNDAFKVTFENVGLVAGTNIVKGFLVIETSVGTTTQIATKITVLDGSQARVVNVPPNSDPNKVDQAYEERIFKKVAGRYFFTVLQTTVTNPDILPPAALPRPTRPVRPLVRPRDG